MFDPAPILARCDALAALTEIPGQVCRTYLSPPHAEANRVVGAWMAEAGLTPRVDAVGNLIGIHRSANPSAKTLVLGSHLDTVRDAGKYDGILGVILALAVAERLREVDLPFSLAVVGFAEEEGVRFCTALIGSRAFSGSFEAGWLARRDADGVSLEDAMRGFGLEPAQVGAAAMPPEEILGYLEVHIEQGPVLEAKGLPVGVVSAICGATRKRYRLAGAAGHAGTVPMELRRDALAGAAEIILAVERIAKAAGVVATVGCLDVAPGAINVIPGAVRFTLDLRAAEDARRVAACAEVDAEIARVAAARGLAVEAETLHDAPSAPCDPALRAAFAAAVSAEGLAVETLASGAGHDAMAVAAIAPSAMVFVRCAGGISHSPAEAVTADDVAVAARVLHRAVLRLAGSEA